MSVPSDKITIAPQAALNEYAAMNEFLRNRNLTLAQAIHELTATVEQLRIENAALNAEFAAKEPA
jgi:hypothetical protein